MKKTSFLFLFTTCFLLDANDQQETIKQKFNPSAVILTDVSQDNRASAIHDACADPKNMILDFSMIELQSKDLETIFEGLVYRSASAIQGKHGVTFLNLTSQNIDEKAVVNFLINCQNGKMVSGRRVFPDVRQTIVKIGFPLSEHALELLEIEAPSLFIGGLSLVG